MDPEIQAELRCLRELMDVRFAASDREVKLARDEQQRAIDLVAGNRSQIVGIVMAFLLSLLAIVASFNKAVKLSTRRQQP